MARLPEGKQHIYPGVYYTLKPVPGSMNLQMELNIRWHGYIFLWFLGVWKTVKGKVVKIRGNHTKP
jgi:hypothetical protein